MFIDSCWPTSENANAVEFPQLDFLKGHMALARVGSAYEFEQVMWVFSSGQEAASLQHTGFLLPHVDGSDPSAPGMQKM